MTFGTYRFTGEDGSMGLKRGHTYNLAVDKYTIIDRFINRFPFSWKIIAFRPFDSNTPIMPYQSQYLFKQNWEKVQ